MNPHKYFFTLGILFFLSLLKVYSQEVAEPYTARAYWLEEKNYIYQNILKRKEKGDSLSANQIEWLKDYSAYLQNYYAKLPPEEKNKYEQFKFQWNEEYQEKTEAEETAFMEEKARGIRPGKKFSLLNGFYGAGYGAAALGIFQADLDNNPELIAVPFFTCGIGLMWPIFNKSRYQNMTYSSVMLARHGKFVGLLHGASLSIAIFGNEIANPAQVLVPMVVGSIGLGELGFQLGKHKNWTEGRIATYRYYGILGPFLGFSALAAVKVESPRPYGITIPLSALAGYWAADKIYKKYQFTRGDMLAASSFGLLSSAIGLGMMPLDNFENDEITWLFPMGTAIAGTLINHAMLKNKRLSAKKGWTVNYVTGAAAVFGVAATILAKPQQSNPYIYVPAAFGAIAWMLSVSSQAKKSVHSSRIDRAGNTSFSFKLMPENYFINKQNMVLHSVKPGLDMPLFNMSMTF